MLVDTIDNINELPTGTFRAKVHYRGGDVRKRRIYRKDTNSRGFAIYASKSRNRGTWYHSFNDNVVAIEPILPKANEQDEETKWRKSWIKALRMLNESELWPDIRDSIELGLSIGMQKIQKAFHAHTNGASIDEIMAIDPRLIKSDGETLNSMIYWRMSYPAKIKKMYFGKGASEHYLSIIDKAMRNKTKESLSTRASYDVHFSYKPELKQAWYSEEYHGCGNGHYYLAISPTHALYYESD